MVLSSLNFRSSNEEWKYFSKISPPSLAALIAVSNMYSLCSSAPFLKREAPRVCVEPCFAFPFLLCRNYCSLDRKIVPCSHWSSFRMSRMELVRGAHPFSLAYLTFLTSLHSGILRTVMYSTPSTSSGQTKILAKLIYSVYKVYSREEMLIEKRR